VLLHSVAQQRELSECSFNASNGLLDASVYSLLL